jgi:hypothetical protein
MRFGGIRKPRLGNRRVQRAALLLAVAACVTAWAHTGSSFSLVDAKTKGWLVGQGGAANTSASTRNLNYSLADVRGMYDGVPACVHGAMSRDTWHMYTEQNTHFIKDGVDFWWNDEGETMHVPP